MDLQLIVPLGSAALGAVVTLLAVAQTNRANLKRAGLEFGYRRDVKNHERRTEKMEELYVQVSEYSHALFMHNAPYLDVADGDWSVQDAQDILSKVLQPDANNKYDLSKIQMLVAVHFPELTPILADLLSCRDQLSRLRNAMQDHMSFPGEFKSQMRNALDRTIKSGETFLKIIAESAGEKSKG